MTQGAVPTLDTQGLDIGPGGFGDPQSVQGQKRGERVLGGRPEPSGDQQGAKLVSVQRGGVGLVIQAGAADMGGWGVSEEFFFDGVPIEARDGAQAGSSRAGG